MAGSVWKKSMAKSGVKDAVNKTISNTLMSGYKASKKTPEDFFKALVENNTTHFTPDELERLLAAFKRVTNDRLQASHFYEIIEAEMGWGNLLLRKQLFKAFDFDRHGDINFTEFAEGYSTMLRGTVPEMLEFAWRMYHIQGLPDLMALTDVYTVLRLALAGLEEVRRVQGGAAGGSTEDTRFPERAARQILEAIVGDRQAALTRQEFNQMVMRHRRLVDCVIPGFELIPQDPLHRAAESGETLECQHLLEVDLLDVDGRDGISFPTTPLHLAAKYGHHEVVAVLLSKGANMRLHSQDGETAMEVAVRYGRMRVLELLLEAGCDVGMPNRFGQTAFHTGAAYGQYKALRTIMPYTQLAATKMRDHQGATPLHMCAASDHWQVIDIFVEYDRLKLADIDVQDYAGRTALHAAAEANSLLVCRKLLELGAEVAATDYNNVSVLNLAARTQGNEAVVNLLLSQEACQVDRADNNGVAPLLAACRAADIKTVRALLAHGADANQAEHGSHRTPLHEATLGKWLEGVDALLAPGVECAVLRDARGATALDYARTQEIFELLRDYVENVYPTWTEDHPVSFTFGITFDEGVWKMQTSGDLLGMYVLNRPRVSKATAAKRMEHKMIDRNSIKKQLRKAGLVVLEEQVRVQEYVLGAIKADIHQYTLFRVGVPLYRLQQEAMKLRLQKKRPDLGRREDFYIDEANYPDTGFLELTLGEKQRVLLNIIQSTPVNESLFVDSAAGTGGDADSRGMEPFVAGIAIAHYRRYQVIHDFNVLHEPAVRRHLQAVWSMRHLATRRFWRRLVADYFSESKHNEFAELVAVRKYFGLKITFYFGFLGFYTNQLLAPSLAGLFAFGMEFVPSKYESEIQDSEAQAAKFDDQYDHPILFVYGAFLCAWLSFMVQGWMAKQRELAFRWDVDDYVEEHRPNPLSTAPVKLQFVNGAWTYRPVLTPAQRVARLHVRLWVSLPVQLAFIALVMLQLASLHLLDEAIDANCDFMRNCGRKNERFNELGRAVFYFFVGMQALVVTVFNSMFERAAVWVTNLENHETVNGYDFYLGIRMIVFSVLNSYSTLFYFAYYKADIDKTAAMMAALMVIGQLSKLGAEYLLPFVTGKEPAESVVKRKLAALQAARDRPDGSGKEAEEGPEIVVTDGAEGEDEEELLARGGHESALMAIYGGKPIADIHMPQETVTETFTQARDEVLNEDQQTVLEFASVMLQFGYIALFGAVWPLAALMCLLNNFAVQRLDMWKFCTFVRRPMGSRTNGIGAFWEVALEAMAVAGITNHAFLMAYSSNTFKEYFFPKVTTWERMFAAFLVQNVLLALYFAVRVTYYNYVPAWVTLKKKESLRFVRDAYRAGCALRERRYRMLITTPHVPMRLVCKAEDLDEAAADRYLSVVRFVDSLGEAERKRILYDSSMTIQALLTTIHLQARGGRWKDAGERPTAAGLLNELVPITDVKRAYMLGKQLREAVYHIWETHQDVLIMGSKAATIMSMRQFACIEVGCTMPQAERYVRLVRYVDALGNNPWLQIAELAEQYPRGLMQVLGAAAEDGQDSGEPVPSELGPLIEPITLAKRAYEKAGVVRRKMYELWVHDKDLQHDELIQLVCEDMGAFRAQLERYLLVKRYCDSLDDTKRKDLLQFSRTKCVKLCADIRVVIRDGGWRDPGEPSFFSHKPPIVVDEAGDGEGEDE
mmetsp:Transcript_8387/g.15900  ORF Transcript_8387/g.15900 Transcript_8387/m.15900 type:complete len:1684 (-) Transcript_8387:1295-6346(-)